MLKDRGFAPCSDRRRLRYEVGVIQAPPRPPLPGAFGFLYQPLHEPGSPLALGLYPGRAILEGEIVYVLEPGFLAAPELHEPFFGQVPVFND